MANPPAQNHSNDIWTIGRLLAWTEDHFETRGIDEPRLSAELLLAKVLDCRRIDLYARYEERPTADRRAAFRTMIRAAAEHTPIAHLIGHKEFYSLDFKVTPDVLIPRPETELLVERALAWCEERLGIGDSGSGPSIRNPQSAIPNRFDLLDIGTGSGCIAVTVVKRQPAVHAVATDISEAALAVAAENAERHGVADRLRCVRADMLDLSADVVPAGGFDLIAANPPYVADHERESLPENVRRYEPEVALFSGGDGLEAFRRIAGGVRGRLRAGGAVILEVGHTQADAVQEIFVAVANLEPVGRFKDLGGIERALQFRLPA